MLERRKKALEQWRSSPIAAQIPWKSGRGVGTARVASAEPQETKKTGLISQGMTEKPGEFSNWYNSGIMQFPGSSLYLTRTEIHWAIKEQYQTFCPKFNL